MNVIEKAAKIAVEAHEGQKRKHDGSPYVVHPFMVAMKVARYECDDDTIAAALVHDVLEDTGFSQEQMKHELGETVTDIVRTVTYAPDLDWVEKRKDYNARVISGSESAKAVSVADKIHNLENLLTTYEKEGSALWEKFNRGREEKVWSEESLLNGLKEVWEHPLLDEYEQLVEKMKQLV